MSKPSLHVAIGIIFYQHQVLVGWRNQNQHQGNTYEFPGGKVELGESPEMACRREVLEEVGLDIPKWHHFDFIQHEYDDIQVNLHLFHSYITNTDVAEIQKPWAWYRREQLQNLNFPSANRLIIKRLVWPHWIKISDNLNQLHGLSENSLMYWRIQHAETHLNALLHCPLDQLSQLIININLWKLLDQQRQQQIFAVHFKQDQLLELNTGQLPVGIACIASCHDLNSLKHAHQVGCDAILLSPVQATTTHPDEEALGWEKFKALAEYAAIPVFALGGLKPADLSDAQHYGAYGVAGIRNF